MGKCRPEMRWWAQIQTDIERGVLRPHPIGAAKEHHNTGGYNHPNNKWAPTMEFHQKGEKNMNGVPRLAIERP